MATDFSRLDELMDGGAIPLAAMSDLTTAERAEPERRWAAARPAPQPMRPETKEMSHDVTSPPPPAARPAASLEQTREAEHKRLLGLFKSWKDSQDLQRRFPTLGSI